MKEKLYEEVGANYRFFLSWRHAAFAGNLLVLYGVFSLCISLAKDVPTQVWIAPLLGSPVGLLLWAIDHRTRALYHAAINAGKVLEGEETGFYTLLKDNVALPEGASPYKKVTHSAALNVFFVGSSLLLVGSAVYLKWFM